MLKMIYSMFFRVFVGNIVITSSECGQRAVSMGLLDIGFRFIFCNYLYFIFYMYMLSLQNIHTLSEDKRKKRKAPSKRKK